MSRVQAVLWDADGVLQRSGEDWHDAYSALPEGFLSEAQHAELPFMTGGDFPTALTALAGSHGVQLPVDDLLAPWRSIVPLTETWAVVDRLRAAGLRCCLASNQHSYRRDHILATLGYQRRLDGTYFSCDLGLAKPDPGYFQAIRADLGLPGQEVLFVDDRDDNVAGAREAGLRAERWDHGDGVDVLLRLLRGHGLPA